MYKKACCTCKLVVLLNNPIVFLTFSLPSPSSLLKLPNIAASPSANSTLIFGSSVVSWVSCYYIGITI